MFNGDRLRKLRKEKNLSQKELGDMMGLDKSTICCYEKDLRTPSIENIIEFMQIFNVSADYLIGADHLIKTYSNENIKHYVLSDEELTFLKELKKDKHVYDILLDDPKRGATIIKNHLN